MDGGAREVFLAGLPAAPASAATAEQLCGASTPPPARLSARPEGPLPGVAAGASPAYDVTERGGDVVELEILLAQE